MAKFVRAIGRAKRAPRVDASRPDVIVVSRGQFKKLMAKDSKDEVPRELRELVLKDRAATRAS